VAELLLGVACDTANAIIPAPVALLRREQGHRGGSRQPGECLVQALAGEGRGRGRGGGGVRGGGGGHLEHGGREGGVLRRPCGDGAHGVVGGRGAGGEGRASSGRGPSRHPGRRATAGRLYPLTESLSNQFLGRRRGSRGHCQIKPWRSLGKRWGKVRESRRGGLPCVAFARGGSGAPAAGAWWQGVGEQRGRGGLAEGLWGKAGRGSRGQMKKVSWMRGRDKGFK